MLRHGGGRGVPVPGFGAVHFVAGGLPHHQRRAVQDLEEQSPDAPLEGDHVRRRAGPEEPARHRAGAPGPEAPERAAFHAAAGQGQRHGPQQAAERRAELVRGHRPRERGVAVAGGALPQRRPPHARRGRVLPRLRAALLHDRRQTPFRRALREGRQHLPVETQLEGRGAHAPRHQHAAHHDRRQLQEAAHHGRRGRAPLLVGRTEVPQLLGGRQQLHGEP
mmetsp:Transcript_32059/g.89754  ORF Transcript_32059/g.89754 Transcript_32059/m.89754 type:complete len:221 (-) Transcript_32059:1100-1762(-)